MQKQYFEKSLLDYPLFCNITKSRYNTNRWGETGSLQNIGRFMNQAQAQAKT